MAPGFMWVLGIQIQIHNLVPQALSPLYSPCAYSFR